jgi:hypothetical protein
MNNQGFLTAFIWFSHFMNNRGIRKQRSIEKLYVCWPDYYLKLYSESSSVMNDVCFP